MSKTSKDYENEFVVMCQAAICAMQRETPDYGNAEQCLSRAESCIKYAREIRSGKYRGEAY